VPSSVGGVADRLLPDWARRVEADLDFGVGKPDYGLFTVQPLYQSEDLVDTLFTQVRLDWVETDRLTTNLGLGYRRLAMDDQLLLGANTFFDSEWTNRHRRVGLGFEVRTSVFEINANTYAAVTGRGRPVPVPFHEGAHPGPRPSRRQHPRRADPAGDERRRGRQRRNGDRQRGAEVMRCRTTVRAAAIVLALTVPWLWPALAAALQPCSSQAANFTGSCSTAATVAQFTLQGFRFRRQSDQQFVPVASTSATFDAASVNAGAAVGAYISGASLSPGTYDAVSPLISATLHLQGSTSGALTCFTKSGSPSFGAAGPAQTATVTITIPPNTPNMSSDGTTVTVTDSSLSGLPLTINGNETITVSVNFGVDSALIFNFTNGTCIGVQPGGLDVSMSLSVQ
jgi:hypothetical protein